MLSDLPLFTDLHKQGGDQSETRSLVWKNTHRSGSSMDLHVDPFQAIGCPDGSSVLKRQIED
jgi:hypothetical protein